MPATDEQLRERWKTEDGQRRLKAIVDALKAKKHWESILAGFPYVEEVKNGRDLRGADPVKAKLVSADLSEGDFSGANLKRANLSEADLSEADFSEANLKRAILSKANLIGARLHKANLSGAKLLGADLSGANPYPADPMKGRPYGTDLSGANLSEATLSGADLSGASLYGAILHLAKLNGANLREADLSEADIKGADFRFTRFDSTTTFIAVDTTKVDWSKNPLLKRHIEDQQWLDAWRRQGWWHKYLWHPLWFVTCNCGRNLWPWLVWSFLIALCFGRIYSLCGDRFLVPNAAPGTTLADVHWFMPFYYSIVTFTTLGFGDVVPHPNDLLAQCCVMCEVIIGFVMLGGLISIFATKLARRA